MEPRRVLVVANQTSGGSELRSEILGRVKEEPHVFTLIVPATPPREHLVFTDEEAVSLAGRRLENALAALRKEGVEITGRVGDASPVLAIADALLIDSYDEILLSTLPAGVSRWLKGDLPDRVRRRFDVPVTVVIAEPAPAPVS
ncbi:MAG: hypothetical protein ACRDKT_12460 [Actinomycetota bacterium]